MPELFSGADIAAGSAFSASAPDASAASDPSTTASGVLPGTESAATGLAVASDDPATTSTDPTTPPPTAAPPEAKWPTILENARQKAAQETKAQYAWADTIAEPHRATVGQFYHLLDQDPTQAVETLMATIANDPQHAPKLRSLLGRILGSRGPGSQPPQPQQVPQTLPEPDFQDESGHTFYSAERAQQMAEVIKAQLKAELAKELHPLKTDLQTRAQREQQAAVEAHKAKAQADADQWAEQRYAKVSQWAHFTENEAEIAQAMQNDPELDVGDAYISVVVPKLSQQERSSVVASLRDKASAASQNPANPAASVARPPKDFREAFERLPAGAWRG